MPSNIHRLLLDGAPRRGLIPPSHHYPKLRPHPKCSPCSQAHQAERERGWLAAQYRRSPHVQHNIASWSVQPRGTGVRSTPTLGLARFRSLSAALDPMPVTCSSPFGWLATLLLTTNDHLAFLPSQSSKLCCLHCAILTASLSRYGAYYSTLSSCAPKALQIVRGDVDYLAVARVPSRHRSTKVLIRNPDPKVVPIPTGLFRV